MLERWKYYFSVFISNLINNFNILWWIFLILVGAYFIYQRYDFIINDSASILDIIILLIWISLLVMPLFQEVSFYGLKLKKEFNTLKSDMKEQIINLRSDVQNSINFKSEISPQIYFYPPPSDSQIPTIEEESRKILQETLKKQGMEVKSEKIEISEEANYLFSVRLEIEKELRRIWKQRFADVETKRQMPINRIANHLVEIELIDSRLAGIIREVYAICSQAIHGEDVSKIKVDFVRDIASELITSLKGIQ